MQNKESIKQIADRMFGITNNSLFSGSSYDFTKDVEDAKRKIDEYNAQHSPNTYNGDIEWIKKQIINSKDGRAIIKTKDFVGMLFPEFLVETAKHRNGEDVLVLRLKTEHDSYINRLDKIKNKSIVGTCPWCGDTLVLRINSKNGNEFAGCSSFPRCKYTEVW